MTLEMPCHIPKEPPNNESSQFSVPALCAAITGVIKNWLAAVSSSRRIMNFGATLPLLENERLRLLRTTSQAMAQANRPK